MEVNISLHINKSLNFKVKKKYICPIVLYFLITSFEISFSQEINTFSTPSNFFIGELGGNGNILSLNYERKIVDDLFFRVGIGLTSITPTDSTNPLAISLCALIMPEYYFHVSSHFNIDIGFGSIILLDPSRKSNWLFDDIGDSSVVILTARFGVNYIPLEEGASLGLAFTPFISTKSFSIIPWAGLSVNVPF